MRQAGLVQKAAALIAVGVDEAGKRTVPGVSVALAVVGVVGRAAITQIIAI